VVFPSYEFAFFFVVVLALSWALMPHPRVWKPFVLSASYVFYAAASPRYCLLLAGLTLANQAGAVLVHRTEDERRRKWIVGVTVAIDLGVLGVFKYYGFFVDEVGAFLDALGLGMPLPLLTLALPIGLSFITFQAISYVVDVKRRLLPPASLIDFGLYLSFFPHVVAGPIVRAREFIPQLSKPRDPRDVAVGAAVVLIALGLIKKVALADYLAREVVDPVFGVPEAYSAPDVALAAYAYAAQIYCDFSGYTDIAIGVALLMGFVFPQNFNSPYRATSFRDFWRRWHMTLSRFLRDFLYIPLGGNRGGKWKTARNLMITMVLGGLWHGAAWTFVLWGGFHGALLVAHHVRARRRSEVPSEDWLHVAGQRAATFALVCVGWVFFRADSLEIGFSLLGRLVTGWTTPNEFLTPLVVTTVLGMLGLQYWPRGMGLWLQAGLSRLKPIPLGLVLSLAMLVIVILGPSGVAPFIYFQF
jgi:alginate O-acetyltransferase complex protein AlgI